LLLKQGTFSTKTGLK